MEKYFYHPISGKLIKASMLKDQHAFIEDRLYIPEIWQSFYYDQKDQNNKTFGIEIELNTALDVNKDPQSRIELCKKLLQVLNRDGKHFHIMRDNSVRNGLELVSAPMTYKYWKKTFNVKEINQLIQSLQLFATVDTGLHIHVGQKHTRRLRELYLQLFAISYPMWVYLSDRRFRRLQERYVSTNYFVEKPQLRNRYLATIKSLIQKEESKVNYAGLGYYDYNINDRYLGLNFFNKNTIEFRMFTGTNDFEDISKYLDFLKNFVDLVDEISDTRINNVFDLNSFVKRTKSELLFKETVKLVKLVNSKEIQGKIYNNLFMFLDAYWYRIPVSQVKRKELALKRTVYEDYLKIMSLINLESLHHNCAENHNLKKDIDQLLINEILEVVEENQDSVSLMSVRGSTDIISVHKSKANKKYVFLRGISRNLVLESFIL